MQEHRLQRRWDHRNKPGNARKITSSYTLTQRNAFKGSPVLAFQASRPNKQQIDPPHPASLAFNRSAAPWLSDITITNNVFRMFGSVAVELKQV